ncbi:hypothetical protein HMPREF3201_00350 [Megasphaera sp. MJR8396C]|nr:hypothetical protein HMPREF3201_00350 [Megasphaera sp. MJR8396C]
MQVFVDDIFNRFRRTEDKAVERANDIDGELGRFFKDVHDLRAIFSDDIDIVAASFIKVIFFKISLIGKDVADGTEVTKGIGTEQDVIRYIIGHDDFRPVNHGGFDELQGVLAQFQLIAFINGHVAIRHGMAEELFKKLKGRRLADDLGFRVFFKQGQGRAGMIRFHVLDNEVVQFAAFEQVFYIFKKFVTARFIHGIDEARLFIIEEIGIISNTLRKGEDPFKQFRPEIVASHPIDTVFNFFYTMHICITSLNSSSTAML